MTGLADFAGQAVHRDAGILLRFDARGSLRIGSLTVVQQRECPLKHEAQDGQRGQQIRQGHGVERESTPAARQRPKFWTC